MDKTFNVKHYPMLAAGHHPIGPPHEQLHKKPAELPVNVWLIFSVPRYHLKTYIKKQSQ